MGETGSKGPSGHAEAVRRALGSPSATLEWFDGPGGLGAVLARDPEGAAGQQRGAVFTPEGLRLSGWEAPGLAGLVRTLGWRPSALPSAERAAFVLEFALWDGLEGLWRPGQIRPVDVEPSAEALLLRHIGDGGLRPEAARITVRLPWGGGAPSIERTPLTASAEITPLTPAIALTRALDADDGAALGAAMGALPPSIDPATARALARVALEAGGALAADAVLRLAAAPDGLRALRTASAASGLAVTGDALALADALWGEGALD